VANKFETDLVVAANQMHQSATGQPMQAKPKAQHKNTDS
jgi:hypothetical protein